MRGIDLQERTERAASERLSRGWRGQVADAAVPEEELWMLACPVTGVATYVAGGFAGLPKLVNPNLRRLVSQVLSINSAVGDGTQPWRC